MYFNSLVLKLKFDGDYCYNCFDNIRKIINEISNLLWWSNRNNFIYLLAVSYYFTKKNMFRDNKAMSEIRPYCCPVYV